MAKKSGINWKWVAGIIGPIASAILIYWLTEGLNRGGDEKPDPPQAQSYSWDGRILDATRGQLLEGVDVSLAVQSTVAPPETFKDTTDSLGRYAFLLPKSVEPIIAVLNVAAQGYKPFIRKFTVEPSGVLEREVEIGLTPAPVTIANAGDAPPPDAPRVILKDVAASILYQPRPQITATNVRLQKSRINR